MISAVPAMLVAGLAIFFIPGTETASCPSDTVVAINVTSSADVLNLTGAINCTGEGVFNVTWYNSLHIDQIIEVSHGKQVTVTGFGFPTIRPGTNYDGDDTGAADDLGSTTGIFSVSNDSGLILKQLVLEGGFSEEGGAVSVTSSSSLYVYDCGFRNNNASTGGAISASNSSEVYVDGTTWFTNNSASIGGAVSASNSTIHFDGSTSFHNNKAGVGGAVYADESALNISGNTYFDHNKAEGAVKTTNFATSSGYYAYTEPVSRGGALYAGSSEVHIGGDISFSHSTAIFGGALCAEFSEVFMYGSTDFSNNIADRDGGALHASYSRIYMDGNGNIANNSASWGGGAVYAEDAGFYVNGSTNFSDNSVPSLFVGGAICALNAEVFMNGDTHFVHNSAGASGGALYAVHADVRINANTSFVQNSAEAGGAVSLIMSSNLSVIGSEEKSGDLVGDEGSLYSEVGSDFHSVGGVAFIENVATDRGGAMYVADYALIQVGNATFRSNKAESGGAVFFALAVDKQTEFRTCFFEGNQASDGGAVYLYTGTGVDIFTDCVFQDNFAKFSGGAIFHTGSLRVSDSSFVANAVGADGPAIMSIGLLEELSNVSFSGNAYRCPAGQYGYILPFCQSTSTFCTSCFDEVCARCANRVNGVPNGDQVQIDGIPLCTGAPSGGTASSKGTTLATLTLDKGYYRTSKTSHDVRECYNEDACVGGNDTDKYCASGYQGPYCAVCDQGFAPGMAYSCRQCSGSVMQSAIGLAVAVALVLLPLAALLFSHLASVVNEEGDDDPDGSVVNGLGGQDKDVEVAHRTWKQKCWSCQSFVVKMLPLTAIKIVVTVWQIISQFGAIAGDIYPDIYTNFVSKLNPFNLDLDFVLSYSCIVATDFYDRLLFATITPLLVLLLLAGSYFIGKKRNGSSESAMNVVRHKHQSAALYLAFLVYSPVSYKIFQAFACDELDDGGTYLWADYSISCSTPRHSTYELYALIMVCVYPLGIPAIFGWLLARHRQDLANPDRETMLHLKPLNGIWGAYRPCRYYYEVVECGRRIVLTAIAAFVLPNSTAQIAIVLLVAFAFVFVSESLSPFENEADTILYRWGNGIIVASIYIALLLKVQVSNDSSDAVSAFSVVLIIANVAMVAMVLLQTAFVVTAWRRAKKEAKEAKLAQAPFPRRMRSMYSRYMDTEDEMKTGW